MGVLVDAAYIAGGVIASPWLAWMAATKPAKFASWKGRLAKTAPLPPAHRPRVLIHAVSVGEVNACRGLIEAIEALPGGPEVVLSVSTATGIERAHALHDGKRTVLRHPIDLSGFVTALLDAVAPDVFVSVELELWPNQVSAANRRGIPWVVVNGRLSERSFRRYAKVRYLTFPMFMGVHAAVAQDAAYAERFRYLGTPGDRVTVAGTMKWDEARIEDDVPGAAALAEAMGIDRGRPLIVAGSTGPGEESMIHAAVASAVPDAQLLCAPRKPERFDEAAAALPGCARRSRGDRGSSTGRFLLDTIGELRMAYALADVVIVGRTFGHLYGSDMMEPVALGKPVVFGPRVDDFRETASALLRGRGALQVAPEALPVAIATLLADRSEGFAMAQRGRDVIRAHQGATRRNADAVADALRTRAAWRGPIS